jgi:hypothetical protein
VAWSLIEIRKRGLSLGMAQENILPAIFTTH